MRRMGTWTRLSRPARVKVGCGGVTILAILLLAALPVSCSTILRGRGLFPAGHRAADLVSETRSFDPGAVRSLDISAGGGDVSVKSADTASGKVEISATRWRDTPASSFTLDGTKLSIDYAPHGRDIEFGWLALLSWMAGGAHAGAETGPHLTITVPPSLATSGDLERLQVLAGSGDCDIEGVACSACVFKITSGKMTGRGISVKRMDIEATSGDVDVRGTIADELEMDMTSGEMSVTCEGAAPHSTTCSMTSGSAKLRLPADSGFTARIRRTSGDFSSDFDLTRSGGVDDNDVWRTGDGSASIRGELTSGALRIDKSSASSIS